MASLALAWRRRISATDPLERRERMGRPYRLVLRAGHDIARAAPSKRGRDKRASYRFDRARLNPKYIGAPAEAVAVENRHRGSRRNLAALRRDAGIIREQGPRPRRRDSKCREQRA